MSNFSMLRRFTAGLTVASTALIGGAAAAIPAYADTTDDTLHATNEGVFESQIWARGYDPETNDRNDPEDRANVVGRLFNVSGSVDG